MTIQCPRCGSEIEADLLIEARFTCCLVCGRCGRRDRRSGGT